MKKFIKVAMTAALSLIMVLGMAMTAFAASPTDIVELPENVIIGENEVDVTLGDVPSDIDALINKDKAAELAEGEKKDENAEGLAASEEIGGRIWIGEIDLGAGYTDGTAVTLDITVNVADGTKIAVYHYNEDLNAWEFIGKYTVASNKITVTFPDGLSPVALFTVNETPATGDSSHVILWGSLMLVAAAGVAGLVAFGKKRR
jgi:hypothetical protein